MVKLILGFILLTYTAVLTVPSFNTVAYAYGSSGEDGSEDGGGDQGGDDGSDSGDSGDGDE
jgi:hypothetical protein